ncbi:MAG: hypothetical protein ABEJ95_03200 [Candidatus Nanohalobium sp.]
MEVDQDEEEEVGENPFSEWRGELDIEEDAMKKLRGERYEP